MQIVSVIGQFNSHKLRELFFKEIRIITDPCAQIFLSAAMTPITRTSVFVWIISIKQWKNEKIPWKRTNNIKSVFFVSSPTLFTFCWSIWISSSSKNLYSIRMTPLQARAYITTSQNRCKGPNVGDASIPLTFKAMCLFAIHVQLGDVVNHYCALVKPDYKDGRMDR